jgi:hypothetical protein
LAVPDSDAQLRLCADKNWGSACSTADPSQGNFCYGVPIYRQWLNANEKQGFDQLKRMMGQATFQRSALTVNHGSYYIDTTISKAAQGALSPNAFNGRGTDRINPGLGVYDLFFVYSKKSTQQTYRLFLGTGRDAGLGAANVKFGYVNIDTKLYTFKVANKGKPGEGALPAGWSSVYTPGDGYLTLKVNMKSLADAFDLTKPEKNPLGQGLCQPPTMCAWNSSNNKCECSIKNKSNYLYDVCNEKNAGGDYAICSWSVKDVDCPAAGCPGLQITFPDDFKPDDAKDHHRPTAGMFAFYTDFNWMVPFNRELLPLANKQCLYSSDPTVCLP